MMTIGQAAASNVQNGQIGVLLSLLPAMLLCSANLVLAQTMAGWLLAWRSNCTLLTGLISPHT